MLLSERFSNSKYHARGENFRLLSMPKRQKDPCTVQCLVCLHETTATPYSILSGRLPCKCSVRPSVDAQEKMERVLREIEGKNLTLLSTHIKDCHAKLDVVCGVCETQFKSSYNSLYLKKAGCPVCNGAVKIPKRVFIKRLEENLKSKGLLFISHNFSYEVEIRATKIEYFCPKCFMKHCTTWASLRKGCACPTCSGYGFQMADTACLYLLQLKRSGRIVGYKYGITKDLHRRLAEINKAGKVSAISADIFMYWEYPEGHIAQMHEKQISGQFPAFLSKDDLPDGFTETVGPSSVEEFLFLQDNLYQEAVWRD